MIIRYPPLPDIILDNVPHIPWAFEMTELTGMTLLLIWFIMIICHKHRLVGIPELYLLKLQVDYRSSNLLTLQVDYSEEVLCHRRYDIPPALCHNVDHKVREYNFILLKILIMMKDLPSLSVPGVHLDCKPRPYGNWANRLRNAYIIWSGAGMSLQGVR